MTTPDTYAKCKALVDALSIDESVTAGVDLTNMATLLQSMLTDSGPKLKPLEWRQGGEPCHLYSQTSFGFYHIDTHRMIWWLSGVFGNGTDPTKIDSIDHGKQLCERDYATRVAALYEMVE